jgi:hypothetical protein
MMEHMPDRSRKRPRDLNSLAVSIVGDATDDGPAEYTYRVEWSDDDNEWVGLCPELPSLSWLDPDKARALAGKDAGGRPTTPAMAAGVENRVWTVRDIAALLD